MLINLNSRQVQNAHHYYNLQTLLPWVCGRNKTWERNIWNSLQIATNVLRASYVLASSSWIGGSWDRSDVNRNSCQDKSSSVTLQNSRLFSFAINRILSKNQSCTKNNLHTYFLFFIFNLRTEHSPSGITNATTQLNFSLFNAHLL